MLKQTMIAMVLLAMLNACTMTQFLNSADETRIAYDYNPVAGSKIGIVLVHMLPSSKESWQPLIPSLTKAGYTTIAIDYRGRGRSTGHLEQPQDYQDIALDVDAAITFLFANGITKVIVIGGSIGANHALLAIARDDRVVAAVLLSPGLNYRGVNIEETSKRITKPILIIASEDDAYSAESSRSLNASLSGRHEIISYKNAGHAEKMLTQPDINEKIVAFLNSVKR